MLEKEGVDSSGKSSVGPLWVWLWNVWVHRNWQSHRLRKRFGALLLNPTAWIRVLLENRFGMGLKFVILLIQHSLTSHCLVRKGDTWDQPEANMSHSVTWSLFTVEMSRLTIQELQRLLRQLQFCSCLAILLYTVTTWCSGELKFRS
jgi:hypothetical protein